MRFRQMFAVININKTDVNWCIQNRQR